MMKNFLKEIFSGTIYSLIIYGIFIKTDRGNNNLSEKNEM
jgi:hypothetical protein